MAEFDYIVVGAGSAACVLADKLSRDGKNTVLVLEAGGTDRRFFIKMPIGYGMTFFDKSVNWMYDTQPNENLNGNASYWPRGKVIGGSSSINAMCYARGLPSDYANWRKLGNVGWGWDDVLPYFNEFERFVGVEGVKESDNPLHISDVYKDMHPLKHIHRQAADEMSIPYVRNMNGEKPEGFGPYQLNTKNGIRCSAADAFLRPALKRSNVSLISKAHVSRILFEGKRAVGIEYQQHGQLKQVRVRRDVILSGGAVNSPLLLQQSGIGAGALLQMHGVDVKHDLPSVGQNLQDHLGISYFYKSNVPTLNDELHSWSGKLWAGMKYILARKGPLRLSVNQNGGFVQSKEGLGHADIQLYFNPVSYNTTQVDNKRELMNPDPFSGFILGFQPCRPTSRGSIKISSADIHASPKICPNYLSTAEDIQGVIDGGRFIQRLASTNAMGQIIKDLAGPDVTQMNDEQIVEDFRARADTIFHPTSSCRMGTSSDNSVVNSRDMKVHGLEGLRIVDASIFPTVTSGNTNAPTIMVAHKGADLILCS